MSTVDVPPPVVEPSRRAPSRPPRDDRALARFELFLFSAVATVLIMRSVLSLSGYPRIGGDGLHIAHVLWGGLLMGVAVVLVEVAPGRRMRVRAALVGGIGFGLFIDEVGKFLTSDVNYFFRPAVAVMYAVFVIFVLAVGALLERERLSDRRRLALAAEALTDLALGELDRPTWRYAVGLLDGIGPDSPYRAAADGVRTGLSFGTVTSAGWWSRIGRWREHARGRMASLLRTRTARGLVVALAAVEGAHVAVNVAVAFLRRGDASVLHVLWDTGLSSAVSAVFTLVGLAAGLLGRQEVAWRWLERAVVVQLLFTQVVVFAREQFVGLVGFGVGLVVLAILRLTHDAGEEVAAFPDPEPGRG